MSADAPWFAEIFNDFGGVIVIARIVDQVALALAARRSMARPVAVLIRLQGNYESSDHHSSE